MVFLVRKMRTLPELRRFKVVVVTDRTDLQKQLTDTAALSGETRAGRQAHRADVKGCSREQGPGLVFAMIQKYVERDLERSAADDEVGRASACSTTTRRSSCWSTRRTARTPAPCTPTC